MPVPPIDLPIYINPAIIEEAIKIFVIDIREALSKPVYLKRAIETIVVPTIPAIVVARATPTVPIVSPSVISRTIFTPTIVADMTVGVTARFLA